MESWGVSLSQEWGQHRKQISFYREGEIMIEAFEALQDEHLAEYDELEASEHEPQTVQCAVCGKHGIQGEQVYYDLLHAHWQCRKSWPCEVEGILLQETEKRIEKLTPVLAMEIV